MGLFSRSTDSDTLVEPRTSHGGGEKGEAPIGKFDGYEVLLEAIVKMFRTGKSPVTPEETLELYAFMEAADESKRQGGAEVKLADVIAKARAEAGKGK